MGVIPSRPGNQTRMAAVFIVALVVVYLLLILLAVALAKAAGASDPDARRAWLDEATATVRERRHAPAGPWTGPERRRRPGLGHAVLS
jgi:hypothetical protein